MGLDSEGGEASCEDLNSGKLETLRQKDLDIDGGSEVEIQKGSDDGMSPVQRTYIADDIPLIEILEDSDGNVPPKTHTCPYCDKAFNRPYRLASHMLTHTNEVCYWSLVLNLC
jgi:Zinc finger, C2H2 type.